MEEEAIRVSPDEVSIEAVMDLEGLGPLSKEINTLFALPCAGMQKTYETPKVVKYELPCASGKIEAVIYKRKNITVPDDPEYFIGQFSINRWRNTVTCQMEIEIVQ